jgi:hypothetical protein
MIPPPLVELLNYILVPIVPSNDIDFAMCPKRSEPLHGHDDADDFDLSDASALAS